MSSICKDDNEFTTYIVTSSQISNEELEKLKTLKLPIIVIDKEEEKKEKNVMSEDYSFEVGM